MGKIENKQDNFVRGFSGVDLYFVVEESHTYELLFVTTRIEDFQTFVGNYPKKSVYHLFRSSILGDDLEWMESYNGFDDMCEVPIGLSDDNMAVLAHASLEQDKTVNQVLIDALEKYIKSEKRLGGCGTRE